MHLGVVSLPLLVNSLTCCLIEKDTEADEYGAEYQFHCLIIEDTVANVRRNE